MTAANELIRRAVVVDATRRPAEHEPRPDPLGPPTSLVLRSSLTPATAGPSPEAIVFALADGFAYAIDGEFGCPLVAGSARSGLAVRAARRHGRGDGPGLRRPA